MAIILNKTDIINISIVFKTLNTWISNLNYGEGINSSDIITFLTILVGIYLSIFCIISTSQSTVIEILIYKNKEENLGIIVVGGIIENIITIIYILFVPSFYYHSFILILLMILSIFSFGKFMKILYLFYRYSNQQTLKDIKEGERYKNDVLLELKSLKDNIRKK